MPFDPSLAAIRFGTGLSPTLAPPQSVAEMLDLLSGPDRSAMEWFVPPYALTRPSFISLREVAQEVRQVRDTPREAEVKTVYDAMLADAQAAQMADFKAVIARQLTTADGLRERLSLFWADHFTVRARNGFSRHLVTPFVEEAIRPYVAGRFSDMLIAVTTHPQMLLYLDQTESMGPNSPQAQRRNRGLNENLARELLELHTVGVGGPYDQTDVRQMAELLTGLGFDPDQGARYRPNYAEPGAETVLGTTYSADARLSTVKQALEGLALHPVTAAHLSRKLATHFVSDLPDRALVEAMTDTYLRTGGDLLAVTAVMLDHPAAWSPVKAKVKRPFDYVTTALRALGVSGHAVVALERRYLRREIMQPMNAMGQAWEQPAGPDGWAEEADAWITPQGMAGRINWALQVPHRFIPQLPDPRDLVLTALGPNAEADVVFAAGAAENIRDGVAVILASADFQRR